LYEGRFRPRLEAATTAKGSRRVHRWHRFNPGSPPPRRGATVDNFRLQT